MRALTVWFLIGLVACKPGDGRIDDSPPKVDPPAGKAPIDDAALFDPDHLIAVQIELAPPDFETIRDESRDFFEALSGNCTAVPFESPYTWFEGDVTVDGERIERAGVRKKGFLGSMSWDKPSLKISTDEWVPGQVMADGTERLTLNNNVQDPSVLNQCLGYSVFAAAGIPAPRCNFAVVSVNGEDLGVYTHVEAVKKDFLRRHFADDDGDLYEGTLSDFADDWSGTFDPKTDSTDPDAAVVAAISAALDTPDDQLIAALEPLIDLDAFYRFWAVESLTAHWDGYASNQNNFFLYRDPSTDQASFVPWGVDQLFSDPQSPAVFLTGRLTQRLWATQAGRDGYVDALERALDTAWDEDALHAEIDRMQALIQDEVNDPEWMAGALEGLRAFVDQRRDVLVPQLQDLRSSGERPTLRDPFCMEDLGLATSGFDTVYGALDDDAFVHGATIDAAMVPAGLTLGSIAGPGDTGEFVVAALGVTADWSQLYQVAVILPPGLGPGTYPVGFEFGTAYLVTVDLTDPYDEGTVIGVVLGEVSFSEIGETPGAPVVGSVSGTLIGGLW